MTVAAVEAPEALSAARARAARRPRRLPDPPRGSRRVSPPRRKAPRPASSTARTGGAFERGVQVRGPGSGGAHRRAEHPTAPVFRGARQHVPTQKAGRSNYQPIILAEFVAAILLTAGSPIASKKHPEGLSPYEGKDMVKLGALTVVYLILALMSAGGRGPGKVAAAFGGLILLAVGINEAANIASELEIFGSAAGKPAGDTAQDLATGPGAGGHKK